MSKLAYLRYETALQVRDRCLCLHVQRAARMLARRFDDVFRPFGLTNGQFSLLMSLNRAEPTGMGAAASLLGMDRTTLTAALKPLERDGLLKVSVDPADRRGRLLMLTAVGRKRLTAALPVWEQTLAAVEAELPGGDPDRFRRGLRALG
jgi:DNA-binding MarR family transcriptional regulator